jgi:hypothetical protein
MGNTTSRGYTVAQISETLADGAAVSFTDGDLVDPNPTLAAEKEAPPSSAIAVAAFRLKRQGPPVGIDSSMSFSKKKTFVYPLTKGDIVEETAPYTLNAKDLNEIINAPWSALAFHINWHMAYRFIGRKSGAAVNQLALAYSLAGITNAATHLLVLEQDPEAAGVKDQAIVRQKVQMEGISDDEAVKIAALPFNKTRACSELTAQDWIQACVLLNRCYVLAYTRRHTLGAWAMPRGQTAPAGTSDKFVSRAMSAMGLNSTVESERNMFYDAAKAIDSVSGVYAQLGVAMSMGLIGKGCQLNLVHMLVRFTYDSAVIRSPYIAIPLDRTNLPRLAGGPAGKRVLGRALTAAMENHDCGTAYVTGTGIDAKKVLTTLAGQMEVFHLLHPAVLALQPQDLKTLANKSADVLLYQSVRRVLAANAAYHEGRSGKPCEVPSDIKAMKMHPDIAAVAKSWGKNFAPKQLDEATSGKLATALASVSGLMSAAVLDADAIKTQFAEMDKEIKTAETVASQKQWDYTTSGKYLDYESEKAEDVQPDVRVSKEAARLAITAAAAARPKAQTPEEFWQSVTVGPSGIGSALFGGPKAKRSRAAIDIAKITAMLGLPAKYLEGIPKMAAAEALRQKFEAQQPIWPGDLGLSSKVFEYLSDRMKITQQEMAKVLSPETGLDRDPNFMRAAANLGEFLAKVFRLQPEDLDSDDKRKGLYVHSAKLHLELAGEIAELTESEREFDSRVLGFNLVDPPQVDVAAAWPLTAAPKY